MKKKHYARKLHLGIGVHTFAGQTMLVASKDMTMEIGEHGVLISHTKLQKKVFVPFSNIKALDLDFSSDFMQDDVPEINMLSASKDVPSLPKAKARN